MTRLNDVKTLKTGETKDILKILTLVSQCKYTHEAREFIETAYSILNSLYFKLERERRRPPTIKELQAEILIELHNRTKGIPKLH